MISTRFVLPCLLAIPFMVFWCKTLPQNKVNLDKAKDVSVLIYPEEIFVRSAITPSKLEANYERRLTISRSQLREWSAFEKRNRNDHMGKGGNAGGLSVGVNY